MVFRSPQSRPFGPSPSLTIYSSCLRLVQSLYSLPWPRAPFRPRVSVSGRGSRVCFGRLTQVTEGGMTLGDSLTLVTQPTSAPYPLSSLNLSLLPKQCCSLLAHTIYSSLLAQLCCSLLSLDLYCLTNLFRTVHSLSFNVSSYSCTLYRHYPAHFLQSAHLDGGSCPLNVGTPLDVDINMLSRRKKSRLYSASKNAVAEAIWQTVTVVVTGKVEVCFLKGEQWVEQ